MKALYITGNRKYLLAFLLPIWITLYVNLASLADLLVYQLVAMEKNSHAANAVYFFVYEVPKVMLLLLLIVFIVGIIRTYFSPEKTRKMLGGKSLITGNVLASLLGIVTPFCSCSAIPLFIGFVQSGIPLGVTFSFLIAAPMINEIALVLLFGLFGWEVALIYAVTGILIAVGAGFVVGLLSPEKYIEEWVFNLRQAEAEVEEIKQSFSDRIQSGIDVTKEIVGKVWLFIILGIAVGAGIHGYVPENFMASLMGSDAWWSVPVSVLIGVPMYSNAAGIIPVVQALLEKGASLGTVLAFMMSVIGLSLPETIILRKVLKMPMIIAFVAVVASGIVFVGIVFNLII